MMKKILNKKNILIGLISLVVIITGLLLFNRDRDMMLVPRLDFTATLLKDGNVLIIGGVVNGQTQKTAEIYNPKTHKSHYTGSMNEHRSGHSAILLDDGRVLIVGGGAIKTIKQAEIYDPKTGKFNFTDSLSAEMINNIIGVLKLYNGDVLIFGVNLTEVYNPQSGKFKILGQPKFRYFGDIAAIEINNDKILIIGRATQKIKEDIFETREGLFSRANYPYNNEHQTLSNGTNVNVEKVGSKYKKTTYRRISSTIFDLKTNKFTQGPDMIKPRRNPKAVKLKNGRVLVFGGTGKYTVSYEDAEIYDPKANKFSFASNMKKIRATMDPVLIKNGKVYVVGGDEHEFSLHKFNIGFPTCEVYDSNQNKFKQTWTCMNSFKYDYIPILLKNDNLLLFGGGNPVMLAKNTAKIRKIEIINTKGIR